MADHDRLDGRDRDLWRRAAPEAGPAAVPDPTLIAAWLDGTLDEAARMAVEDRLSRSPEWLELALSADPGTAGDAPVAAVDLARARALVRDERRVTLGVGRAVRRPPVWLARGAALAFAAAITVVVSAGAGFWLGQSVYRDIARAGELMAGGVPPEVAALLVEPSDMDEMNLLLDEGPTS